MAIIVKHGAALEGRGMAYGAAARTAYIRRQEEKEKEKEKKAKRLGNIGSALSTAGAVASFIPGLQPVGIGLSIAGGALGQAAGGRGDPAGQAIASTAQGISQIYQAQGRKVEARQQEWEDWKKRSDYTHELSGLKKAETLDREVEIRDQEFLHRHRVETRKFLDQRDALMDEFNLGAYKTKSLEELDALFSLPEAGPPTPLQNQQYHAWKQIRPKYVELKENYRANIASINEARLMDTTITLEEYDKQQREAADNQKELLKSQQEAIEDQAKIARDVAAEQSASINTNANIIADVGDRLSKSVDKEPGEPGYLTEEAKGDLRKQQNLATGNLSIAMTGRVETTKALLVNGDRETMRLSTDAWIDRRAKELVAQHRAGSDRDLSEELWNRHLGKTVNDCKRIAKAEFEKMKEEYPLHTLQELAELLVAIQSGVGDFFPTSIPTPTPTPSPPNEKIPRGDNAAPAPTPTPSPSPGPPNEKVFYRSSFDSPWKYGTPPTPTPPSGNIPWRYNARK